MAKGMKLQSKYYRSSLGDRLFDIGNIIFMLVLVVFTLYPFLNTLAVSLNDANDSIRGGIYLFPRDFTWYNYEYIFKQSAIVSAIGISVLRTIIGTIITVFCSAMLAYTISRQEYVLRKFVTIVFVLTLYFHGGLIPTFLLMRDLHLLNNFWVYILPGVIGVFNLIVMRSFIDGLPDGIIESAKIDGAGDFQVFIRIVMPLIIPVLATVALWTAVFQWNSWFDVFLYNSSSPHLSTLQYELMRILQNSNSAMTSRTPFGGPDGGSGFVTPTATRATMTIVASVPIILVYPFLQKYFVKGMTLGGVKG